MATGIQWCDETWNPLRARRHDDGVRDGWACVRVSPGCLNCYASTLNESQRWGRGTGLAYTVPNLAKVEHYLDEKTLTQPLRWKKPRRVFVCSMTDLFGEWVTDEQLDHIFAVMALTPQHTYQVLTKRPERMRAYLTHRSDFVALIKRQMEAIDRKAPGFIPWPLPNVWLGVSVEDQERADERIPLLLDTPAAVRFLSCEPLLGPVDLARYLQRSRMVCSNGMRVGCSCRACERRQAGLSTTTERVDWVIVGGESGPNARPFDLAWARSLVQQCQDADVAVFVKQMGSDPGTGGHHPPMRSGPDPRCEERGVYGCPGWHPLRLRHNHGGNPEEWPEDLRVREFPAGHADWFSQAVAS